MYDLIKHIISEIKNETVEIYKKICDGLDKDTLHLVNDKINKIMNQSKKNLIKIIGDILCQ